MFFLYIYCWLAFGAEDWVLCRFEVLMVSAHPCDERAFCTFKIWIFMGSNFFIVLSAVVRFVFDIFLGLSVFFSARSSAFSWPISFVQCGSSAFYLFSVRYSAFFRWNWNMIDLSLSGGPSFLVLWAVVCCLLHKNILWHMWLQEPVVIAIDVPFLF